MSFTSSSHAFHMVYSSSAISHKNQIYIKDEKCRFIALGKVTPRSYSYTEAFKIAHARLTCLCFLLAVELWQWLFDSWHALDLPLPLFCGDAVVVKVFSAFCCHKSECVDGV